MWNMLPEAEGGGEKGGGLRVGFIPPVHRNIFCFFVAVISMFFLLISKKRRFSRLGSLYISQIEFHI